MYRDSPAWCSRRLKQVESAVDTAFNVFPEAPFLIPLCVRVYTHSPQVQIVKKNPSVRISCSPDSSIPVSSLGTPVKTLPLHQLFWLLYHVSLFFPSYIFLLNNFALEVPLIFTAVSWHAAFTQRYLFWTLFDILMVACINCKTFYMVLKSLGSGKRAAVCFVFHMESGLTNMFEKKKITARRCGQTAKPLHGLDWVSGLRGSENCTWPVENSSSALVRCLAVCCREMCCAELCSCSHTTEIRFNMCQAFDSIVLSTC